MRKITLLSMISLDGVMQAPGGPEEDTSGGFAYGGWSAPLGDDIYNEVVQKELQPAEYLLGRKTFEIWENFWPQHADFWPGINEGKKYVLSDTRNQTNWQNTSFIQTVDDVRKIKNTSGPGIHIWGSSEVVHLLLEHDLIDELRLKIHPIILGKGKKLFDDNATAAAYTLTESLVTTKGVIIAVYARVGDVQTGRAGG